MLTAPRRHRLAILEWLDEPAPDRGIRFAVDDGWELYSWDRLAGLARCAAAGLTDHGVVNGDVVVIADRTGPTFVATLFGALLAGATPAPLPPPGPFQPVGRYALALSDALNVANPSVVAIGGRFFEQVAPLARAAGAAPVDTADLLSANGQRTGWPNPPPAALLQFTSGSSGHARGVRVRMSALEANLEAIRRWLRIGPDDATASWLPVHHDMGLIGCLLTPASAGGDLWLMRPEQFLRDPLRYLRCFDTGGARLGAMPAFGLDHVVSQVPVAALDGLALNDWKALIVGAERIGPGSLERFARLLAHAGFSPSTLLPAYGLAEATLAVSGVPLAGRWRTTSAPAGTKVVGCGTPLAGVVITIEDAEGRPVGEGCPGEIVVRGPSVAQSSAVDDGMAPEDADIRTGDAGLMHDGELFVLGRYGDALKVRGRFVLAEDVEAELALSGLEPRRCVALLGHDDGIATVVAVLEEATAPERTTALRVLRRVTECSRVVVIDAPKGTIERTPSGKPRRRVLWDAYDNGQLAGTGHIQRPVGVADQGRGTDV